MTTKLFCCFRRGAIKAFAAAFAFGGIAAESATIDFTGRKTTLPGLSAQILDGSALCGWS